MDADISLTKMPVIFNFKILEQNVYQVEFTRL